MTEKLNAINNAVTAGATPIITALLTPAIFGVVTWLVVLFWKSPENSTKKARKQRELIARMLGFITFIALLPSTFGVVSKIPQAPSMPQTEQISASDFSLWPPILITIAIASLTAFLSFKKKINFKNFKEPTYSPDINPTKANVNWSLELLREIEWRRFEFVCEAVFKELGLRTETLLFGADGGIDIRLYREGSNHPDAIVQCKAWNSKQVGVKEIRELLGVMTDGKVSEGIFMITNNFHKDAITFASNNNIDLKNGQDVIELINKLSADAQKRIFDIATEGDYKTPTCASCGIKMVKKEGFWGCENFPKGCKNKIYFKSA